MRKQYVVSIEILVIFLSLETAGFVWFSNDPGFLTLNPHPYFLPIIMVALHYGFLPGITAGICASILLYFHMDFRLLSDFHSPDIALGKFVSLGLFIAAGGIIGESKDRLRKRMEFFRSHSRSQQEKLDNLSSRYDAIQTTVQEMETKLTGMMKSQTTFFDISRRFATLSEQDVYRELLTIVREQIGADSCSVYRLNGKGLLLEEAMQTEQAEPLPSRIEGGDGIWSVAIDRKRVISLPEYQQHSEFREEKNTGYQAMLSAPLLHKDKVIGVVNVEKMPFLNLNLSQVKMFDMLAHLASMSIDNARKFLKAQEQKTIDDETGALTFHYFKNRMSQEYTRARRNKQPVFVLLLKIERYDSISETARAPMMRALGSILLTTLRGVDLVARYLACDIITCYLDSATKEGFGIVKRKIIKNIKSYDFKPYVDSEEGLDFILEGFHVDPAQESMEDFLQRFELGEVEIVLRRGGNEERV